jgi:hypothetical protein
MTSKRREEPERSDNPLDSGFRRNDELKKGEFERSEYQDDSRVRGNEVKARARAKTSAPAKLEHQRNNQ